MQQSESVPMAAAEVSAEVPFLEAHFENMSLTERRDYFFENGFVLVPGVLNAARLQKIYGDIERAGLGERGTPFDIPEFAAQIANPEMLRTVRAIYGQDLRFFKGVYWAKKQEPRSEMARQWLHFDWGTTEHADDFRNTSPSWVNVGMYLDSLTPDNGPLYIVPGSHRRLDLAPGTRVEAEFSTHVRRVLARAGDAVLFHCFTAHAGGHNFSNGPRRALFYSYRPGWATPIGPVPEWPESAAAMFINAAGSTDVSLLKNLSNGMLRPAVMK